MLNYQSNIFIFHKTNFIFYLIEVSQIVNKIRTTLFLAYANCNQLYYKYPLNKSNKRLFQFFFQKYNRINRRNQLHKKMGGQNKPVLLTKSPNIPVARVIRQEHSPSSKTVFKYINPKELNDENQQIIDEDIVSQTQVQQKLNTEEYKSMEENIAQQTVTTEIKVKWNHFVKMKKKNYLDDYVIIKEIGRGGFGKVNKVRSRYTGLFRAAKKIKKSTLGQQQHQKLFLEMSIMQSLDHINITRLFEVYDYKSHYVLILELCEGGQLFKKILVSNGLTEAYIAGVIKQILKALLYLKHKGIIHRDLKPQNMLFQKDSHLLKIIDFGIAAQRVGEQRLSQRVGTPYYVAPEVLLKSYDQKCDIWSTGVIMYMMLTRRPPFRGNDQQQVMKNILSADPVFSSQIKSKYSPECISFIKSMLIKNPHERIDVEAAFNHPWFQKLGKNVNAIETEQEVIHQIENFKFKNKLQAVVYTFIVSQLMTTEQKSIITQIFEQLDKNHDGVISRLQFRTALATKSKIAQGRMSFLMRVIDTNSSGYIDLTQFIVAGLKLKEAFNQQHFQQAFSYFDIDHSGSISFEQIAFFLEDNVKDSQDNIKRIFKDIDENNDGVISREQFVHLLMRNNRQKFLHGIKN